MSCAPSQSGLDVDGAASALWAIAAPQAAALMDVRSAAVSCDRHRLRSAIGRHMISKVSRLTTRLPLMGERPRPLHHVAAGGSRECRLPGVAMLFSYDGHWGGASASGRQRTSQRRR